jgi:hypothetical protein
VEGERASLRDARIFACDGGGAGWRRLSVDDLASVESLRAGLQLVTREGPVSEAELIEFRARSRRSPRRPAQP